MVFGNILERRKNEFQIYKLYLNMLNIESFGYVPNLKYKDRRAAYAVIITGSDRMAAVKGREKYWLPGGGSLKEETAEETILREVREELGRTVRLIQEIGQAIQYFY